MLSQPNLTTFQVFNLQIPANGVVNALAMALPSSIYGGADGYTVDLASLAQLQQGQFFIPQACTIDATALTTNVVFSIPALGFKRIIPAGTGATFQFPALQYATIQIEPNDGVSAFNVVWYNFPALPDTWSTT
jgi:hypothetical protein